MSDVLAVLDREIADMRDCEPVIASVFAPRLGQLREARAAVADLLNALEKARAELAGLPRSLGYEFTHLPEIDAAIDKATKP